MNSTGNNSSSRNRTRRQFLKKTGLAAAGVASTGFLPMPLSARDEIPPVSIVTGPGFGPAAQHGMEKIQAALKDKNLSFERMSTLAAARGKTILVAGLAGDSRLFPASLAEFCRTVPDAAESLAIRRVSFEGKPTYAVAGSDDSGLMYAQLDVADRIRWGSDAAFPLSEVRDVVEKPNIRTRSVTLYTFQRAYWEQRFYDEAYWQRYFDTLARNRFNMVRLTFGYENAGFMAPCYPYFFDVPEFPQVKMTGMTAAQQRRNVEALNRLINMAHARGIKVTLGIWDHIYRGAVQSGGTPDGTIDLSQASSGVYRGVSDENLIPYTKVAIKDFLKTFPGVDGIQFRLHDESGLKKEQQSAFWQEIFQTISEIAPTMPLDFRAKGLTSAEIQSALDTKVNFYIDTKVWMEQMGLPFHPTHINPGDQSNRRHSYADLLAYPKKYNMDWQLWTGGTSRILLWGNPEYVRRFVECTHLYEGDSFGVNEPLTTKMQAQAHDVKPFDLLKPSARYYDYEFERYWHFLQLFGRIGYSPTASSEIWDREFVERFGEAAGPVLEDALHRASWILPRIIASSYPYGGFPMTLGWAEKQHLGDLPEFAKGTLSDVQLFENFDEEAQLLIENGETAKVRPQETSRWFAQTADEVMAKVVEAEKKIGKNQSKEFDSTIVDLKILVNLARYHSYRIPAAVSYRLFDRTKDVRALDEAIAYETKAVGAWRQIVESARDMYTSDLMMGRRPKGLCGHWKDELKELEAGLTKLQEERKSAPTNPASIPSPLYAVADNLSAAVVRHQPILEAPSLKPLTVRATVNAETGIKWVQVLYRSVNQTKDYEILEMKPVNGGGEYDAVIPAEKIDPKFDFMYLIQVMDNRRKGTMFPDFNKTTPYFVVRLERNT